MYRGWTPHALFSCSGFSSLSLSLLVVQSAANPPPIDSQFVWDNIRTAITVASGTRASEVRA